MPSLINQSKNQVQWDQSQGYDSIVLGGLGPIQAALQGRGVLYSWAPKGKGATWYGEFDLSQDRPASYTLKGSDLVLDLDPALKSPCAGIITGMDEGYIIAPSIKLKVSEGREIAMMLLSPTPATHEVSLDKTTLSTPDSEGMVMISTEEGEVRCQGTVSGRFKTARLVLNRNPGLPVYREGFNQTLCVHRGPGELYTTWKPASRHFQELLLIFDPFHIKAKIQDDLRDHFRASEDDTEFFEDLVVGDTGDVNYTISLVVDRGLGRHSSDHVRLILG